MYQPSSGQITTSSDGVMLEDISVRYLRERIALVSQAPVLFDCSIGENIAYGMSPAPSHADIVHAAQLAGIDVFVCSLPLGYGTMLSAGGGGLSSGQKQRVAIARALVRKPELLVLDECTSGLDAHNVGLMAEVIGGLVREKRCTVLMVTHSIELMRIAQRCVLLGPGGVILEEGTYHNLWIRSLEFRRLVNQTW
jgi:ATP-binding cassette subfamily B (MDR/TAP) protein 1